MMLTLLTLLRLLSLAAGVHHAVCPNQTILATPGDDVSLPCRLDAPLNLTAHTVEWRRELDKSVVHLYRHRLDDPLPQLDQYRGRTAVNRGELGRGVLTLQMFSVQLSDSATYRCFVTKGRNWRASCTTRLVVAQQDTITRGQSSTSTPPVEQRTEPANRDAANTKAVVLRVVGGAVVAAVLIVILVNSRKLQIRRKTPRGMQGQDDGSSGMRLRTQTPERDEGPDNAPENDPESRWSVTVAVHHQ